MASSRRAPSRTFAASSTKRSKKRTSRGIRRRRNWFLRGRTGSWPTVDKGAGLMRGSCELRRARVRAGRSSTMADPIPSEVDVPTLARRLRDRLDASEFELDQQVRNASYLADLMGVGIVRLDEHGIVELANAAAHILLRRPAGSLRGRTALETFVDGRVEELI